MTVVAGKQNSKPKKRRFPFRRCVVIALVLVAGRWRDSIYLDRASKHATGATSAADREAKRYVRNLQLSESK